MILKPVADTMQKNTRGDSPLALLRRARAGMVRSNKRVSMENSAGKLQICLLIERRKGHYRD